jgi:heptosyltransferase II
MTRIVIIQTAFPGDVILSLPLYEALDDIDSGCHLGAVVRPESACFLRNNPFVDEIISFDKYGADKGPGGIARLASKLHGFDKAIIVQRYFRSAIVPILAKIPNRIGYDNSGARLTYTTKITYREDVHEVQRCLDLISVDNHDGKYKPKIYLGKASSNEADRLLEMNGINSKFAVVAPGSIWATKRYVHYAELIDLIYDKLNMPVVLVGGTDDIGLSKGISGDCEHTPVNLTGNTDFLLSAAIISKASLAIANDSAPAHIAAAVDTPVVAIFGPTSPSFGFAPYSTKSIVVDIGKLYCRPCTRHGSDKCPEGHFRCMKELLPERIIEAAKLLLSGRI